MNNNQKVYPNNLGEFIQSMIKLEALENMTRNLEEQLEDSQRMMTEIKAMCDTLPKPQFIIQNPNDLCHDDLPKFLDEGAPKLIMPDMEEDTYEVDVDDVIASMKVYAEDLKKNIRVMDVRSEDVKVTKEIEKLALEQYAMSLDVLGKRLSNVKLNRKVEGNDRNAELEAKLTQLCDNVKLFTQMVQSKTKFNENKKNRKEVPKEDHILSYDEIINKVLSGINEVTYLLKNKN